MNSKKHHIISLRSKPKSIIKKIMCLRQFLFYLSVSYSTDRIFSTRPVLISTQVHQKNTS